MAIEIDKAAISPPEQVASIATQVASFFTVAELAELACVSRQAVDNAIRKSGFEVDWNKNEGETQQGQRKKLIPSNIAFAAYPKAKLAYEAQQLQIVDEAKSENEAKEARKAEQSIIDSMTTAERRVKDARSFILNYLDGQADELGTLERAINLFLADACRGVLPPNIQELIKIANVRSGKGNRTVTRSTIYEWRKSRKAGPSELAPKARVFREPAWAIYLLKAYRTPQKRSLSEVLRDLPAILLPKGISPPSRGQADRYLEKVGNVYKQRGRMGKRELKSIQPHMRRNTENLFPLAVVTADGHTFDAEVTHPYTGRPFRPEIIMLICVYTRKIVGVAVFLNESALIVMEAVRRCFLNAGVPVIFYWDNGKGFKNQDIRALSERFGVTIEHSIPYNSQARGLIEAANKVWIELAKRFPTYIGPDMDREAKQIAYKATRRKDPLGKGEPGILPSWNQFVDFAKASIEMYNNRPHKGLPFTTDERGRKVRMSPNQKWQEAVDAGWEPSLLDNGDLHELLPCEDRKVKRGEISLHSNRYFSRELAEYNGDKARVAFDPWNPEKVWVSDFDGRLLAIAELDGNKTDYFPLPYVEQCLEKREQSKEDRALKKIERRRDTPTLPAAQVVEMSDAQKEIARAYMEKNGIASSTAQLEANSA